MTEAHTFGSLLIAASLLLGACGGSRKQSHLPPPEYELDGEKPRTTASAAPLTEPPVAITTSTVVPVPSASVAPLASTTAATSANAAPSAVPAASTKTTAKVPPKK